jgi:hypothetical protein
MEKLINCNIFLDIHMIENISGGNQEFEILVTSTNGKILIVFGICAIQ